MNRWLVVVEVIYVGFLDVHITQRWQYYRWRWLARLDTWLTNIVPVPPGGVPIIQQATFLGRVRLKHA